MIKFVHHGANETVKDINILAEENYAIEKDKAVRAGIMYINELYDKKMTLGKKKVSK